MSDLYDIQNLRYEADGKTIIAVEALSLAAGSHSVLLGRSGSGKSTLMNLMAGLLTPRAGKIYFEGQDLASLGEAAKDRIRGRKMGFIFQGLHLLRYLTVRQNIVLGVESGVAREARLDEILETLGLAGYAARKASSLSHGEAQRVAIARALIHNPAVIFADEPTSALDDDNARAVMALLLTQAEKAGATLCVATHDSRIRDYLGNVIHIEAGRIGTA